VSGSRNCWRSLPLLDDSGLKCPAPEPDRHREVMAGSCRLVVQDMPPRQERARRNGSEYLGRSMPLRTGGCCGRSLHVAGFVPAES